MNMHKSAPWDLGQGRAVRIEQHPLPRPNLPFPGPLPRPIEFHFFPHSIQLSQPVSLADVPCSGRQQESKQCSQIPASIPCSVLECANSAFMTLMITLWQSVSVEEVLEHWPE